MKTLPDEFRDSSVCVLGLGYVGLTLSVALSKVGFRVRGVEVVEAVLEQLKDGEPHFWEKGLAKDLKRTLQSKNFSVSNDLSDMPAASVYIITVGTPLGTNGEARLDMIAKATEQISGHIQDGALIVLRSTVRIGTARDVVKPILDKTGKRYEIAVCPERTLEGNAIAELNSLPQIIGADNPETLYRASQLFSALTPTTVQVGSLETAECIKLVDNSYRDLTFAFGNEVARLCNAIGINAKEVIDRGKLGYARTNVALPGPVGGPCLSKDPHILAESAQLYGISLDLVPAARRVNERQPAEIAAFLKNQFRDRTSLPPIAKVSLLGLAFKGNPANADLRGTMAAPMLEELQYHFPDSEFFGFDAVVAPQEIKEFGLNLACDVESAFDGASIVIILNDHKVFQDMDIDSLSKKMMPDSIIFDCWNLFEPSDLILRKDVNYHSIGAGHLVQPPEEKG